MRKVDSIIILLLFLFSCGIPEDNTTPKKNKISLKKIFESIADTNSSICIKKEELRLFTQFEDELAIFNAQQYKRYEKTFATIAGDSLVLQHPGKGVSENELQSRYMVNKKQVSCYDSLDSYAFQYDSIFPIELKLAGGEKIDKIKNVGNLFACTTFNTTKWETTIHVLVDEQYFSAKIAEELELADFFICDIVGDDLPEIFVVKHVMMPSTVAGNTPIISLDIYKVHKSN